MLQILCLSNNVLVGNKQDQIKLIFTNRISYETREKTSHRERERERGREGSRETRELGTYRQPHITTQQKKNHL